MTSNSKQPENLAIHPSSLERYSKCPGSFRMEIAARAAGYQEETSDIAEEGTLLHAQIMDACLPGNRRIACANEVVDHARLFFLQQLEKYPPENENAVSFEETIFSNFAGQDIEGTPDVHWYSPRGICHIVIDWKTGFKTKDHTEQIKGYAYMVNEDEAYTLAFVYYTRYRQVSEKVITRADAESFIRNTIRNMSATLNPGTWCEYCPARSGCPALMQNVIQPKIPTAAEAIALATPSQIREWADRLFIVKKACEALDKRVRELVRANPGDFPHWEIASRGGPRTVPTDALRRIVVEQHRVLTDSEFQAATKVSVAEVEKLWEERRKDAIGTKKGAKAEFQAAISGVVKQEQQETVTYVGPKEEMF